MCCMLSAQGHYHDTNLTGNRHALDRYKNFMTHMMKKTCIFLLTLIWCTAVYAATAAQHLAKDCKQIQRHTQAGLQHYQKKQYIQARSQFQRQAGLLEACRLMDDVQFSDEKVAIAYNNVALTYLRQAAQNSKKSAANWLKAFAWLNLAPSDSKSQYNFKQQEANIASLQKQLKNRVVGTYWRYAGQALWNEISIIKKSKRQYRLSFEGYYTNKRTPYYGPNIGALSVDIRIKNNQSVFTIPEYDCKYTLMFTQRGIRIKRLAGMSSCGFGHNVAMQGDYVRVSP